MRITDMITQNEFAWNFIIFSPLLLSGMNRGNKWKFKFWSYGLKGKSSLYFRRDSDALTGPVSFLPDKRLVIRPVLTYALPGARGGGGGTPYITYTGMCRPTGSWFWSSWFRTAYPFQRRFLEQGIIFRTHESSSFVSSHLKLFKDRLHLKIRFNALTSKLLYSLHLKTEYKNWRISRMGYQF